MKIAIRKEPNGSIYIDKNLRSGIPYTEPPYNFTIIEVEKEDCQAEDFNDDLTFRLEKYKARKQKEVATKRIVDLKQLLADSDYKAIKYAEGLISEEEYSNIRAMRQAYRLEINELEEKIKEV